MLWGCLGWWIFLSSEHCRRNGKRNFKYFFFGVGHEAQSSRANNLHNKMASPIVNNQNSQSTLHGNTDMTASAMLYMMVCTAACTSITKKQNIKRRSFSELIAPTLQRQARQTALRVAPTNHERKQQSVCSRCLSWENLSHKLIGSLVPSGLRELPRVIRASKSSPRCGERISFEYRVLGLLLVRSWGTRRPFLGPAKLEHFTTAAAGASYPTKCLYN